MRHPLLLASMITIAAAMFFSFTPIPLHAQASTSSENSASLSASQTPVPELTLRPDNSADQNAGGIQTKRIMDLVPNFEAVSADAEMPSLSAKQKFWLATQGSFDYSSFAFAGLQAGVEEATNTYPQFHTGTTGFGRYYWHVLTDQTVGNYFSGAIFPSITDQDPRYYTLYHGSFAHRAFYAFTRVFVTRTDAGKATFNTSEILGNATAMEISSLYYPAAQRTSAGGVCERWAVQIITDGISNIFEEFWPDINRKFFHEK